jgi:uncharacterized membrane protein YfcA
MRPVVSRLVITGVILVFFGVALPAILGVEPFSYLRLSVLVLAAAVLLLRWLKREERPYDDLDGCRRRQNRPPRTRGAPSGR